MYGGGGEDYCPRYNLTTNSQSRVVSNREGIIVLSSGTIFEIARALARSVSRVSRCPNLLQNYSRDVK